MVVKCFLFFLHWQQFGVSSGWKFLSLFPILSRLQRWLVRGSRARWRSTGRSSSNGTWRWAWSWRCFDRSWSGSPYKSSWRPARWRGHALQTRLMVSVSIEMMETHHHHHLYVGFSKQCKCFTLKFTGLVMYPIFTLYIFHTMKTLSLSALRHCSLDECCWLTEWL